MVKIGYVNSPRLKKIHLCFGIEGVIGWC